MKKFRFILALVLVLTMVLSTPLMVVAKEWDASTSDDVANAFATDTDKDVVINMKNDINMDATLIANEGQNYTINGNGNTIADVEIYGAGDVTIEADVTGEDNYAALAVGDEANVTVNGDVIGQDGDPGEVDTTDPEDFSDGGVGVIATGEAEVTVNGDVTGGDAYGTYGWAGDGIEAMDQAKVTVNGDVTGGSVTADPDVEAYYNEYDESYSVSQGGNGVDAYDDASVTVNGNVTGGSTNGDLGNGGVGVNAYNYVSYEEEEDVSASVTVTGDVTGGNATNGNGGIGVEAHETASVNVGGDVTGGDATTGEAGAGIYTTNDTTITVGGDVTGGTATEGGESGNGIVAEYYGMYWEDNDLGVEQGTVTVEGTVSGGDGAAAIFFAAPEELAEMMEEIGKVNLEAALNKAPADLTMEDIFALSLAVEAMQENGDLTEEEVERYVAEMESVNSSEEEMALIQKIVKAEMNQKIDLLAEFVDNIGMDYSLITVGSVSEKNGPAYDSTIGQEFAKAMAEKHVTQTAVTPATGDGFNPMMVLAAALVSLMGVCALVVKKKAA